MLNWAKKIGYQKVINSTTGQDAPWMFDQASYFLKSVRALVGLDETAFFLSTGAAPRKTTVDFFAELDIPLWN